ncbi:MAG: hypothetical protein ABJD68_13470 [Nakamurella sp.]
MARENAESEAADRQSGLDRVAAQWVHVHTLQWRAQLGTGNKELGPYADAPIGVIDPSDTAAVALGSRPMGMTAESTGRPANDAPRRSRVRSRPGNGSINGQGFEHRVHQRTDDFR